jgi:hypothetical protein
MNKSHKKERGVVAILVAIMMMIFLAMAAFAIDIGYYFVIKNRLQNAVDAAALNGVDTIYRANSLTGFPGSYVTAAEAAVYDSLSLNDFPDTDPKITSTSIVVDWWDNSLIAPAGHYHYPAVQVSMSYDVGVFFAKIFDIAKIGVNVTATAVTPIPNDIKPVIPFVITYCTIDTRWDPATPSSPGGPRPGAAPFNIGKATGSSTLFDSNSNCVADNIRGAIAAGTRVLRVTSGDFKRLSVGTALRDAAGLLPNNITIVGVGSPTGTGICTSATPFCEYHLSANVPNAILDTNIITADSGPLGNWTPLVYQESAAGASTINSYIPPINNNTIVPSVSIGQEIRVQTGTVDTLYQATQDCFVSGECDLVTLPVVSGLKCASGTSCPATSTSDPDFPLTGVKLAPIGIPLNDNFPIMGFACVRITSVDTGSVKRINATLATGCPIYGEGGGQVYYGVLLPPVLVH